MLVLVPLCFLATLVTAASRIVPFWAPWLYPAGMGAYCFVEWRHEEAATSGDPEPGLVGLVGEVSVGVLVVGILLGYGIRAWNRRRDPDATSRRPGR